MTTTPEPTAQAPQEPRPDGSQNEPPVGPHDPPQGRHIPRGKIWLFGAVLLLISFGMYAGTMYRIKSYGYVGAGADQPIKPDVQLTK